MDNDDIDIDLPALAAGIIKLAVLDAKWRPSRPARTKGAEQFHAAAWRHRESALRFISGAEFDWWRHVGGFDVTRVRHAINGALRDGPTRRTNALRYPSTRRAAA